jgi:hypothetical protein
MSAPHPDAAKPRRRLACCCCGESFMGRQFANQDTGHGLGPCCDSYVSSRGYSEDAIRRTYGVRGVHWSCEA